MIIYYKALCGILVITGTYILSKQLFEQSFRKSVNFEFKELPWYLQLVIILFGDKRKYENKELWMGESFPTHEDFPWRKKLKIIGPFIGFILIFLGTMGTLLF